MGMYQLVLNWWVQYGAGECKGSCPALPVHHKTVVLHYSYPNAVYTPPIETYICPDGHHWTWEYYHCIGLDIRVVRFSNSLHTRYA